MGCSAYGGHGIVPANGCKEQVRCWPWWVPRRQWLQRFALGEYILAMGRSCSRNSRSSSRRDKRGRSPSLAADRKLLEAWEAADKEQACHSHSANHKKARRGGKKKRKLSDPNLSGSPSARTPTQPQQPAASGERPHGLISRAKVMDRVEKQETRRKESERRVYQTVDRDECLACGKKGHRKVDCPLKSSQCARCLRMGHVQESCWRTTTARGEILEPGASAVPKAKAPAAAPAMVPPAQAPPAPAQHMEAEQAIHTTVFRQRVMERAAQIVAEQVMK